MIGERLKKLREASGLSQRELGELFNAGQTTIGAWELNRREPPFQTLVAMADYFNVSLDYLFERTDQKEFGRMDLSNYEEVDSLERRVLRGYRMLPPTKKEMIHKQLDIRTSVQ